MFNKIIINSRNGDPICNIDIPDGADIYIEDSEDLTLHFHNSEEKEPIGIMLDIYHGKCEQGADLLKEDSYMYDSLKEEIQG